LKVRRPFCRYSIMPRNSSPPPPPPRIPPEIWTLHNQNQNHTNSINEEQAAIRAREDELRMAEIAKAEALHKERIDRRLNSRRKLIVDAEF
jgi:hypothetical protein